MKRSVMIEIMNEAIKEWHELLRGNVQGYTVTDHILTRMEEAGIHPPIVEDNCLNPIDIPNYIMLGWDDE